MNETTSTEALSTVTTALDALVQRAAEVLGYDEETARHHLARHLLFANRPLCPERELRAAMPDAEFWDHVAGAPAWDPADLPGWEGWASETDLDPVSTPCPSCGCAGACGHDDEGRPLIHAVMP